MKFLDFFNKKQTIIGKVIWSLNCVLIIVFFNFILLILLNPFNFLKDFVFSIFIALQLIYAIIIHHLKLQFKLFPFLDNLPILYHLFLFIVLLFIYLGSINHIWKNKKSYIK